MREILFRAKQKDNGEWIEGYYACESNHACFKGELKHHHYIWKDVFMDWNLGGLEQYEIFPETVRQYTGLTDKDGNKIFEGDICQTKGFPLIDELPFVVEWNPEECSFYWRDIKGTDEFNIGVSQNTIVIGNIHDNPELLKGGKDK